MTQRGLDRREVFFEDGDYEVYLALVQSCASKFGTDLPGFCLMPNHVHWVAAPQSGIHDAWKLKSELRAAST